MDKHKLVIIFLFGKLGLSESYYAKYQHMSEKTIKKRILLAQLHALEQEAFMKREIGNMYAQKNKMLDVQKCSNCQPNFCESHVRTFTGQDVMTNMPQYQPSTVTLPRQNQSPQMSPEKSLQASPQMSPVRSSPFRTPKSPIIGLQQKSVGCLKHIVRKLNIFLSCLDAFAFF